MKEKIVLFVIIIVLFSLAYFLMISPLIKTKKRMGKESLDQIAQIIDLDCEIKALNNESCYYFGWCEEVTSWNEKNGKCFYEISNTEVKITLNGENCFSGLNIETKRKLQYFLQE